MSDSFRDGEIKGVVIRKLAKAEDSRGWLAEIFRKTSWTESFFRRWPISPRQSGCHARTS